MSMAAAGALLFARGVTAALGIHAVVSNIPPSGGTSLSDHLFALAETVLTVAGAVAAALSVPLWKEWRAGREAKRRIDHDAHHQQEQHDLARLITADDPNAEIRLLLEERDRLDAEIRRRARGRKP